MTRRSLIGLVLLLLIMPLVRFVEAWSKPEFRRIVTARYRFTDVRVWFDGVELTGVKEVTFSEVAR